MANRSNNIWAKAAAGSPGTNIARAQQPRWTGVPNETAAADQPSFRGLTPFGLSSAALRSPKGQSLCVVDVS